MPVNNRVTPLMIMFLAATPLVSFTRLFFVLYEHFSGTSSEEEAELSGVTLEQLLGLSRKKSTDLEAVFKLFSQNHPNYPLLQAYPLASSWMTNSYSANKAEIMHNDIQTIVPWLFVFIIIILIPLISLLWTFSPMSTIYSRGVLQHGTKQRRHTRRLERLQAYMKHYTTVVPSDDIIEVLGTQGQGPFENQDFSRHGTSLIENDSYISIPKASISIGDKHQRNRMVQATCAICLDSYGVGESVSWSSNKECCHHYHQSCILTWLEKRRDLQCPCCRQDFLIT